MLKIGTRTVVGNDPVDCSFRGGVGTDCPLDPERPVPGFPDAMTPVLLGDEECGPAVNLVAMLPGQDRELFPAHQHASDNWRISIKGEFQMGNVHYPPGHFRLQRGWRNYPGDSFSTGPDGGWMVLVFADRRGMRVRPAREEPEQAAPDEAALAAFAWAQEVYGTGNDIFGDTTSEDSAIAASLPERERGWHVDSSFDRAPDWVDTGDGTRVAGVLLGQRDRGPLLLLSRTLPGATASPGCTVGTELLRVVVRGDCSIGELRYDTGDCRIEPAGAAIPPVVAGPDGLDEILLFGDRSRLAPSADDAGWTRVVGQTLTDLGAALDARHTTGTVPA